MPILDPSIQCFLIQSIEENEGKDGYGFILRQLQIASRNLNKNSTTIETSIQFKKDFERSISIINDEFKCEFTTTKSLGSSFNHNCYKYFYKHLKVNNKEEESHKISGRYRICNDKFKTRFFQPYIFNSKYHSWFFTDTPIAILSIDSELLLSINDQEKNQHKILQLIKLEIDIISGSGLTLVLCLNYAPNLNEFLAKVIQDDQFSEIHCNIFDDNNLKPFLNQFQNKSNFLKGFFYLYCHFVEKNTEERSLMKKFKKIANTTVITFSQSPQKSLQRHEFYPTRPFMHRKSGFHSDYLRIFLCFVPLFESETDEDSFIPSDVSKVCLSYVKTTDFSISKGKRVKILFEDENDQNHHKTKYVNFNDIHSIRPDFFVKDPLSITKINEAEIQQIGSIKSKIESQMNDNKKFQRKLLFNLLNTRKYEECLQYVGYAYSDFIRKSIPEFSIHRSQIYAALEACKTCFSIKKDPKESRGVIYQVDTGEGKSCIICLIASVLALKKYTVHIASSNIKLSNRDYYNSYGFFEQLGLKSAVLLHKNELPYRNTKQSNPTGKNKNADNEYLDEENNDENQQNRLPLGDLYRYESDSFFKSNADYYYNENMQKNEEFYKKNYPKEFFDDELFKNPSRMNFSVCGIHNNSISEHKANVIFSTFVNFECFYLHLMEMCPGYIDGYFNKCGLLIDEADSFLIDEITNGTIVSREVKSNAKEILTFVYEQKMKNKAAEETFKELKKHRMCSDLQLIDVEEMYKEIETVNSEEYSNGTKYSVETFEVRNNHRIRNFIRKTIRKVMNISDTFSEFLDEMLFNKNDDDDEYEEEDEDEEISTRKSRKFKQIIPFDYNHKGILEPNKEFGGFIQQFISIKESKTKENQDVVFRDISMSYLYISHPIFANLYKNICGFTGTVGNSSDKQIYQDHYQLSTKKVPRHKTNLRVSFPMIICDTIDERNEKIAKEVHHFHEQGIPVLVIFQELTEIDKFQELLFETGIKYINIFNGKDEYVSPDRIAGIKGSVSLGTNVCGRGTDIQFRGKPLHVIVSFYSSNVRVMNQAFGRTARQGQEGTSRCICLKSQIFNKQANTKISQMKKSVEEFEYKIETQKKFIEYYKEIRPWIFDFDIEKQEIPKKHIIKMRKARINVNRIVAYKYKFPICMTVGTFLKIQAQKIFSLFNCPNSKYAWRLFQRHIREMILESWSLMIHKFEQKMNQQKAINIEHYKQTLDEEIELLHKEVDFYLPQKHCNIISTFMHIHRRVVKKYQKSILNSFKKLGKAYLSFGESKYTLFQLGFKPYSLLSRSGARINYTNIGETNFIEDPELKYQRKMPDNKFSFISITERIDQIFNAIFQKISSTLGEKVYLKFFLRRTLAGCEFGLCFDINLINSDEKLQKRKYCLIDKDPLLVFTIFLWSMTPIMAGILIFVLVYITGLCQKIMTWIEAFPEELIRHGVIGAINLVVPEIADFFLEKIASYFEGILEDQILKLSPKDKVIVEELKRIFVGREFEKAGETISDKISSLLGGIIKIPSKLEEIIKGSINVTLLMKIGFLLLLCLGTYIRNFMNRKDAIKDAKTNAETYDSTFDKKESQNPSEDSNSTTTTNEEPKSSGQKLNEILENEKIDCELSQIPSIDNSKIKTINESYEKVSKTYLYKLKTLNLSKYELKPSDFNAIDDEEILSKFERRKVIYKSNKKKYIRLKFSIKDVDVINTVSMYAANIHPAISRFFGYYVAKKNLFVFVESVGNEFLSDYFVKSDETRFLNSTDKLIISYGIAAAFEYLHSHKIAGLYRDNDFFALDSQFYPYLYALSRSIFLNNQRDIFEDVRSVSPEEVENVDSKDFSFASDVFGYAMLLFDMVIGKNDMSREAGLKYMHSIQIGRRPKFDDSAPLAWRSLIEKCWDADPDKRPTFTYICDLLESETFVNPSINIVAFNDYKKIIKPYRPSNNEQNKQNKE